VTQYSLYCVKVFFNKKKFIKPHFSGKLKSFEICILVQSFTVKEKVTRNLST